MIWDGRPPLDASVSSHVSPERPSPEEYVGVDGGSNRSQLSRSGTFFLVETLRPSLGDCGEEYELLSLDRYRLNKLLVVSLF